MWNFIEYLLNCVYMMIPLDFNWNATLAVFFQFPYEMVSSTIPKKSNLFCLLGICRGLHSLCNCITQWIPKWFLPCLCLFNQISAPFWFDIIRWSARNQNQQQRNQFFLFINNTVVKANGSKFRWFVIDHTYIVYTFQINLELDRMKYKQTTSTECDDTFWFV